jgi:hypothetical protein
LDLLRDLSLFPNQTVGKNTRGISVREASESFQSMTKIAIVRKARIAVCLKNSASVSEPAVCTRSISAETREINSPVEL